MLTIKRGWIFRIKTIGIVSKKPLKLRQSASSVRRGTTYCSQQHLEMYSTVRRAVRRALRLYRLYQIVFGPLFFFCWIMSSIVLDGMLA